MAVIWNDYMWPLSVGSLHGLAWASLKHGGWFTRVSVPKEWQVEAVSLFMT